MVNWARCKNIGRAATDSTECKITEGKNGQGNGEETGKHCFSGEGVEIEVLSKSYECTNSPLENCESAGLKKSVGALTSGLLSLKGSWNKAGGKGVQKEEFARFADSGAAK